MSGGGSIARLVAQEARTTGRVTKAQLRALRRADAKGLIRRPLSNNGLTKAVYESMMRRMVPAYVTPTHDGDYYITEEGRRVSSQP